MSVSGLCVVAAKEMSLRERKRERGKEEGEGEGEGKGKGGVRACVSAWQNNSEKNRLSFRRPLPKCCCVFKEA